MLEDDHAEALEVQRGQRGVERAHKVLVEPLGLLNLEAYPLDGAELLLGQVDNEAYTEVVEPCKMSARRGPRTGQTNIQSSSCIF